MPFRKLVGSYKDYTLSTHVIEAGYLAVDTNTGDLRIGDGSNPGGTSLDQGYYLPVSGTANTGGGGGGTAGPYGVNTSGQGGSGVVILRVATANYSGTTTGSPTVTNSGTDTIMVFNSTGSYTA